MHTSSAALSRLETASPAQSNGQRRMDDLVDGAGATAYTLRARSVGEAKCRFLTKNFADAIHGDFWGGHTDDGGDRYPLFVPRMRFLATMCDVHADRVASACVIAMTRNP